MANENMIGLSLDIDTQKAQREIDEFKKKNDGDTITLNVDADVSKVQQKVKNIHTNIDAKIDSSNINQQVKQINNQINKSANSAHIPIEFDVKDQGKLDNQIRHMVAQMTAAKGELSSYKISTDGNDEAYRVALKYKNELQQVIDTTLVLRKVSSSMDSMGVEHSFYQWEEGAKAYSQNLQALEKQQERAVENASKITRKREELERQMALINSQASKAGFTLSDEDTTEFNRIAESASTMEDIKQLESYVKLARLELQRLNAEVDKGSHASSLETLAVKIQEMPEDIDLLEAKFRALYKSISADVPTNLTETIGNLRKDLSSFSSIDDPSERIASYNKMLQTVNSLQKQYQIASQNQRNITIDLPQIQNANEYGTYAAQVQALDERFRRLGIDLPDVQAQLNELRIAQAQLDSVLSRDSVTVEEAQTAWDKYSNKLQNVNKSMTAVTKQYMNADAIKNTSTQLRKFLSENTAISPDAKNQITAFINELNTAAAVTKNRGEEIKATWREIAQAEREAGREGDNYINSLRKAASNMAQYINSSMLVFGVYNKIAEAFYELVDVNSILTEISKTSDMTNVELEKLGDSSYEAASEFGRSAQDYLTAVQEMSRSGFYGELGENMAKMSLMAQSAGDLTADVANKYLIATNAAYKYGGSIKDLTAVLDGQNMITNRQSVSMNDMATAMEKAGSVASSYRVSVEDLSAMIGTMEAVTKLDGAEIGNGLKSLLINLQNVTSSKIVGTLDKANASMTEMVNGTERLRTPIEILRDLAKTFTELDEADPLRAEILTNVGGKYQATRLSALLNNMDLYDEMLENYKEGTGSAAIEAEKSANNIEGSLNKLSNTWNDVINNLSNDEGIITAINGFNGLLQIINDVTSAFGSFGSISMIAEGILSANGLGFVNFDENGMTTIVDAIKSMKTEQQLLNKDSQSFINHIQTMGTAGISDLDAVAKGFGNVDARVITAAKDLQAGKISMAQFSEQTKGASAATMTMANSLKTMGANLGIMLAINLAIKAMSYAWDKLNVTVEESKQKLTDTQNVISQLKDEIAKLESIDANSLTQGQKDKLANLKEQLATEEALEEIEKRRIAREATGNEWTDLFDKDSYKRVKGKADYDFTYNLVKASKKESAYLEAKGKVSGLQDKLSNTDINDTEYQKFEAQLEKEQEKVRKYTESLKDLQDNYLTTKADAQAKRLEIQSYIDDGSLVGSDLDDAKAEVESLDKLIKGVDKQITHINTLLYGGDDSWESVLAEKTKYSIKNLQDNGFSDDELQLLATLDFDPNSSLTELRNVLDVAQSNANENPINVPVITNISQALSYTPTDDEGNETDSSLDAKITSYRNAMKDLDKYLNKIANDKFDSDDILDLAQSYGIVGDSIADTKAKIEEFKHEQVEAITDAIKQMIDITADENTKAMLQALLQELTKLQTIDVSTPLDKIYTLSDGLDQLDKIYADVYDKKDIDFSNFLGNTDFKNAFGDLNYYEDFINTISKYPDDLGKCQNAFDALTTEYIYNSNELKNISRDTQDATEKFLEQKGIANAHVIVLKALADAGYELTAAEQAEIDKVLELQRAEAQEYYSKHDLVDLSPEAVQAYLNEASAAGITESAVMDLIVQENILNNTSLDMSGKISALQSLAEGFGIVLDGAAAVQQTLQNMDNVKGLTAGLTSFGMESIAEGMVISVADDFKQQMAAKFGQISAHNTGGSSYQKAVDKANKNNNKNKNKGNSAKDSKTSIDWLERALTELQKKIDLTKSKFETLFTFKSKDNNIKKQITQTTSLLKAEAAAAKRYRTSYNSYMSKKVRIKDKDGKEKKSTVKAVLDKAGVTKKDIQEGRLKGKNLIKEYGQDTAKVIQEAQSRWDKYQDSEKAYFDKVNEVTDLVQQRIDLITDKFDKKRDKLSTSESLLETKYDNIGTDNVTAKNKNLDSQIKNAKKEAETYADELTEKKKVRKSYSNSVTKSLKNGNIKGNKKSDIAAIKKKIKSYIKDGKTVPDSLIVKTSDPLTTNLLKYNESVDDVTNAAANKKQADEEYKTTKREKTIEQYQNNADKLNRRAEVYSQKAANATSYEEKNKHIAEALRLTRLEYEEQIKIAKAEGNNIEVQRLKLELIQKERDTYLDMFNSISEGYDNFVKQYTHMSSMLDKAITNQQSQGHLVSNIFYQGELSQANSQLATMTAEYNELLSEFNSGKFKYGTTQWVSARDKLFSLQESIEDVENNIISLNNTMRDNDWSFLAKQIEYINNLIDEQTFAVDLLKEHNLFEENGTFNNYGQATSAMYAGMMKSYKEEAEQYGKEAQKILDEYNAKLAAGDYDSTLYEKYQEYIKAQREAIKNTISQKNSIKSLIKESYEKMISYLDKIIGRYKEALEAEAELYDYQKSIKEKTIKVTNLNAQIQALQGDNSEESRNRLQGLFSELADAEEDLQDTEYNQWRKDQSTMLDSLSDEMSEWLQELLENEQAIEQKIQEQINAANANASSISNTITTEVGKVGYTMTSELQQAVSSSNGIFNAISNSITAIKDMVAEWKNKSDTEAQTKVETVKTQQQGLTMDKPITQTQQQTNNTKTTTDISEMEKLWSQTAPKLSGSSYAVKYADEYNAAASKIKSGVTEAEKNQIVSAFTKTSDDYIAKYNKAMANEAAKFISENASPATKAKSEYSDINQKLYDNKEKWYSGSKKVLTKVELQELAKNLGIPYDNASKTGALYKKLHEIGLKGFAKGGRVDEKDGIPLKDIGVRASNGDTQLVPVKNKEGFLTEKQTDAVEELAITLKDGSVLTPYKGACGFSEKQLASFKSNALNGTVGFAGMNQFGMPMTDVVHNNNTSQNVSVSMGDIVMQGVQDTEAFAKELKSVMNNDRSVQKVTQSITVDLLAGKNSLAGRKYR